MGPDSRRDDVEVVEGMVGNPGRLTWPSSQGHPKLSNELSLDSD